MTAISDARAREIAEALDEADEAIETYQGTKRDVLGGLRNELKDAGLTKAQIAAEIGGLKLAQARRRKQRTRPEAAEVDAERDELADHYAAVLSRATHVREAA